MYRKNTLVACKKALPSRRPQKVQGAASRMPKQTIPTAESRQDNRGVWRVREDDLAAYIDAAYEKTAERIAAGQVPDTEAAVED